VVLTFHGAAVTWRPGFVALNRAVVLARRGCADRMDAIGRHAVKRPARWLFGTGVTDVASVPVVKSLT